MSADLVPRIDIRLAPSVVTAMNESQRRDVLAELKELREENARLKSLLAVHGIPWQEGQGNCPSGQAISLPSHRDSQHLDTAARVSLFRRLFRGRTDVYAVRWESANGKSG